MLKIERDKVYLDGRGKRFRIVCVDKTKGDAQYPVIGVSDDGDIYTYTPSGVFHTNEKSEYDLVREVKEKKVVYLNVYQNDLCAHSDRKDADGHATSARIACVRVEYEEGQFDD